MGIVIYAFPGTGKTHYCKDLKNNSIELRSEDFHWIDSDKSEYLKGKYSKENPDWPNNYLIALKEAIKKYKYVFITHSGSIICESENIPYYMIFPLSSLKEEYIKRFIERKNNKEFINNMKSNFEKYILSCYENKYAQKKIILKNNEYVTDALKEIEKEKKFLLNVNQDNSNKKMLKTKEYCKKNNSTKALLIFSDLKKSNIKGSKIIGKFYSSTDFHNIYEYNDHIIVQPFLGSPNAAGLIEELNYYGIKKILAIGSALKVDSSLKHSLVLVQKAYVGEGTSKYYNEKLITKTSKKQNEEIENWLLQNKVEYVTGDIFSTDAYYRESLDLIEYLLNNKIVAIDMECSCFTTVCYNKNIDFSQLLVFKDEIKNGKWEKKIKNKDIQNYMINLGINIINEISS